MSERLISELMKAARMPRFCRWATWSFINATSGLMTRQMPGRAKAGTWKVMDLPPPVGISASVSVPANTLRITSSCPGRKLG